MATVELRPHRMTNRALSLIQVVDALPVGNSVGVRFGRAYRAAGLEGTKTQSLKFERVDDLLVGVPTERRIDGRSSEKGRTLNKENQIRVTLPREDLDVFASDVDAVLDEDTPTPVSVWVGDRLLAFGPQLTRTISFEVALDEDERVA